MRQNPKDNRLEEQMENIEVTRNNTKSQTYQSKTPEELSDLELEIEDCISDNTKDREANLIKGEIVDVEFNEEARKIIFTVEFEDNKGKFTIDNFIDQKTDSKSDKIKLLENRADARIENTSKFFNQQLYIVRHETGQLYGFIPKRRHKLTYTIFGDYIVYNGDDIFPGRILFGTLSILVSVLAAVAGGIMMGNGLLNAVVLTIVFTGLGICVIGPILAATGSFVNESTCDKSVYEISEIEQYEI
jgi:hypothetical protein